MKDLLPEIEAWTREGQPFALATVVQTWGSAPRAAGSRMVVGADGRIAGSVSGGCVEAAVVEAAHEVLRTATPKLLHFGVADETAWAVGLACGGTIEVFVEKPDPLFLDRARRLVQEDQAAVLATVVEGPLAGRWLAARPEGPGEGTLGKLTEPVRAAALGVLGEGKSVRTRVGEVAVFLDVLRPAPTLVIVGGVHIAIGLTRETAVAVLSHDPKLVDPALRAALVSPAFYVGALGSKTTQAKRRQRLLEAGLSEPQVDRLHAPIGLDLGGRSPEEIALSVMAQVVAVRNGRGGAVRDPAGPAR